MTTSTDKAAYLIEHERAVAAWEVARRAPPPRPRVPKRAPSRIEHVPMRDGLALYTELHFPDAPPPWPLVLLRTPYPDSTYPWSARPIGPMLAGGYAVAVQACRGTWKSPGRFRFLHNEGQDGFDTIEWLATQPWCTGRVGMVGSSYSGTAQWLAAMEHPPHLTCIAPQSPAGDFFYETPRTGGVLVKEHLLSWPKLVYCHAWEDMGLEFPSEHPVPAEQMRHRPNAEAFARYLREDFAAMVHEMVEHSTYDAWWERITLTPEKARAISIPVLAITGFHDADQTGALHDWKLVEHHAIAGNAHRYLLVGPWRHHQMHTGVAEPMGRVSFGPEASIDFPALVRGFFDVYLKGESRPPVPLPRRCRLYTSGSNIWREFPSYPPPSAQSTRFYFDGAGPANSRWGGGTLSRTPAGTMAVNVMPSDPDHLAPLVGPGQDANDADSRHDVLVYATPVLDEDLTVLGPVLAEIHIAADAPDADLFVRIEDVWPDGASINMTGELGCGPFRARYRNGFEQEVPLEPGVPTKLSFHVCHMGHTFRRGHRLRVALAATASHMFEPNHHTGEPDLHAVARRKALISVFHDIERPSCVVLQVLEDDLSSRDSRGRPA